MRTIPPGEELLTAKEVADRLSISVNTVKRLGDRGEIPYVRVVSRGDRRYRARDVALYVARMTVRGERG